jgi:integrase
MFFTGRRPEEAIALGWSDLSAKKEHIGLQRVRPLRGTQRDGTKTHIVRGVNLNAGALLALDVMEKYTRYKTHDGTEMDIFQNPVSGRPWHDERSQRDHDWKPTLKVLGIRERRAYVSRHTFATLALMKGIRPAYIAQQLGHSLQMLLEVYARWVPSQDEGAEAARLDSAMGVPNFP